MLTCLGLPFWLNFAFISLLVCISTLVCVSALVCPGSYTLSSVLVAVAGSLHLFPGLMPSRAMPGYLDNLWASTSRLLCSRRVLKLVRVSAKTSLPSRFQPSTMRFDKNLGILPYLLLLICLGLPLPWPTLLSRPLNDLILFTVVRSVVLVTYVPRTYPENLAPEAVLLCFCSFWLDLIRWHGFGKPCFSVCFRTYSIVYL